MSQIIPDEQILQAALKVMAKHGFTGATTRLIAAEADVNEVTLFRRFGNKKKLLFAIVQREAETFGASAIEYSGDVKLDLTHIVQFYNQLVTERGPVLAMLLLEIPRQPDLMELLEFPKTIVARAAALIHRYQVEGVLIDEPPMESFAALVGPLLFRQIIGMMDPDFYPESAKSETIVARFLAGRFLNNHQTGEVE